MNRLFGIFAALLLSGMAAAAEDTLTTKALPGLGGRTGLTTIVLNVQGTYTVPARCTGPALLSLLQDLWPHLEAGKDASPMPTLMSVPDPAALRHLANALEVRDRLMARYQALLAACEKGE